MVDGGGFLDFGSDEDEDVERIQISSIVPSVPEVDEESEGSCSMVFVFEGLIMPVEEELKVSKSRRKRQDADLNSRSELNQSSRVF